ncbi:hypothetical protein [Polyangium aurulentum]|uniref:hypothetical protein n=1 Tax=Polyangium aurulentum TaxID=2567896 RepID=UPI0010AE4E23|nr:hypothetical protein [Polyangium aurulentum]UQA59471.1 hypothetical protein E8A73_002880 [Polyangium aurulentum]
MLGSLGHAGARRLGVAFLALAAPACSGAPPTKASPPPPPARAGLRLDAALQGGGRLFHTAIDEAFWVSHAPDRDRVVSSGVRLELSPAGEVLAAAWEVELALTGDPLVGSLAVAEHLGGGFVHWGRNRLFRSETFTGPLRPVAIEGALGPGGGIRGARGGLDAVLVFGDAATASLRPGKDRLEPAPEAGILDFAAIDARRALRVDVLGRLASTGDGGATWIDATSQTGLAAKTLLVEPDALAVETWQGRYTLGADGKLGPLEGLLRAGGPGNKAFQPILRGSRVEEREPWWAWRDTPPVQAAVVSGARFAPGRGVAVAPNAAGDVDLATGEMRNAVTDWPPPGLLCSAVAGPDEPLFVCGWEPYQGYGAYVLRAPQGVLPPVVERAFSDDGYFVADDEGALAFVGSCALSPRLVDPNDPARVEMGTEMKPSTTICVRRGPGDWVEQSVTLDPPAELYGWAPRSDGTAIAIVFDPRAEGLPEPTRAEPRTVEGGGVRVVRILPETAGWTITRPAWNPYGTYVSGMRGPLGPLVERRWQAREGGGVEGWLSPINNPEQVMAVRAAATIDAAGRITVHPPPPRAAAMVINGDYGLAVASGGELFETLDHGVTWRAAGHSPLPPGSFGGACSALGCALGPITRLGWGPPRVDPAVRADALPRPAEGPPSPVRLTCTPSGSPEPLPEEGDERSRNRVSWQTGYGDTIALVREAEPAANEGAPGDDANAPPMALPAEVAKLLGGQKLVPAQPGKSPGGKPSGARPGTATPLRTHSLLFRPPFDPSATVRRLDATGADLEDGRRSIIMPLLAPDGGVSLLFITDKQEIIVGAERVSTLPLFEPRRYAPTDGAVTSGLLLGPERALIMGEVRRRAALEDHGPPPHRPPLLLGPERDNTSRRPTAIARREDGALGMLVWDGSPPEVVSIAELDRAGGAFTPRTPLAPWSTATPADDPRCRDDKQGWRAFVPIEPGRWLSLDESALPGVELMASGAALVRWGKERVCVEAIDVSAQRRAEGESAAQATLVARFGAAKGQSRGASIRSAGLKQVLTCRIEGAKGEQARASQPQRPLR